MTMVPATRPPSEPKATQDFYALRREGIGHIEKTGSAEWTDYNTHDPGISILEALAYAITELGYRTGFAIADILASATPGAASEDPYPGQAFYTARDILTVNPTIPDDLRRLLIDAGPVRNAWVECKTCACEVPFFAWCEDGRQILSHDPSQRTDPEAALVRVEPRGLYDVLLELEPDPDLGDLNDRKIVRRRTVTAPGGRRHLVTVEVRFPPWDLHRRHQRQLFAGDENPFTLTVSGPNRTKTGTTPVDDTALRNHWRDVFYVDLEIELDDGTKIPIDNASVRLFGTSDARRQMTVADLLAWLGDTSTEGFVEPYRRKLAATDEAVATARAELERHRNLDEDYCHIGPVEITEIGVCADIEVEPAADIELVQARIWFETERYLDPPVAFWSLAELLARGEPVEALFNGPRLSRGFLTEQGLHHADLHPEVRVSDIIDRLIDIDGVISVANLQLIAYDADGKPMKGMADPDWIGGTPSFDPEQVSAYWLLSLPPRHRPRLHRRLSRFLFVGNGLPFVSRLDEAEDTLVQLHGEAARPKIGATDLDLPLPAGRPRDMDSYHPVQYGFPLVYGIGPAGLPSTASPLRRAQARQLKAYLLVYEQLLRNAYAQVAGAGDLFSLDPGVEHTYFTALFDEPQITGYTDLVTGLTADKLAGLAESPSEAVERRNRFLDHLLARFGENLGDYAMLLTDLEGHTTARRHLIRDKIAFLRALPRLGHDRGKAFNREIAPCDPDNASGLHQRVSLLLGLRDLTFVYHAEKAADPPGFSHTLRLEEHGNPVVSFVPPVAVATALADLLAESGLDTSSDGWSISSDDGQIHLTKTGDTGPGTVTTLLGRGTGGAAGALGSALVTAQRALLAEMVLTDRYQIAFSGNRWKVTVSDGDGNQIGTGNEVFPTKDEAAAFVARLATWSAHKRAIVVEHLLLRPKFPGDAVYPTCAEGPGCGCGCGDEDPYSFRLTYVMPGWTAPFSTNIAMRRFAERTIGEQTPSHLVVKTCWVGNDGFVPDPCHPVVTALAAVLEEASVPPQDACDCATEILDAYAKAFDVWFADNTMVSHPAPALATTLAKVFDTAVDLSGVSCSAAVDTAVRAEVQPVMVRHFTGIARHGYQFERFEEAWCRWADAEAAMDWTGECLLDTVVEILAAGVDTTAVSHDELCTCAATILAERGTHFRHWMEGNIAAGRALDEFDAFAPPPVTPCSSLSLAPGVATQVEHLLAERYAAYTEVSHRLRMLLRALVKLRNTYPSATLHDCDAGSDFNPVRLGQTALGST